MSIGEIGARRASAIAAALLPRFGAVELTRAIRTDASNSAHGKQNRRSFWKIDGRTGDSPLTFHVRICTLKRSVETSRILSGRGLPVPELLASIQLGDEQIDVWSHEDGDTYSSFNTMPSEAVVSTVRSIARVTAALHAAPETMKLPSRAWWVAPCHRRVSWKLTHQQRREFGRHLQVLKSIEDLACFELTEADSVLTHNDLKGPNVLINGDKATIVDWENVSMGPHGASLRRFSSGKGKFERLAAETYVEEMGRQGVSVCPKRLLRVMRFQEIFWLLNGNTIHKERIPMGLKLLVSALARPVAYCAFCFFGMDIFLLEYEAIAAHRNR
ncbi:aminoglycoside phosphotransferase family protein [Aliihoeflea sp. 2WW]|uniref:aminoglycoside phosphotransferase family protein n=1 Tax=Aliihoeflea sp. 2WW TaxID=1381123 RepID=UPI0004638B06|nr:aminoglycoside phosphotransferase family protein [Aliihoeflea sp. 2WW]